jgi:S1-C subfamily serine protease
MRLIFALFVLLFLGTDSYSKTIFIRCEPSENGSGGACGSGFFISKNRILTANHVVDSKNFRVEFDNKYFPVKILKRDKDRDLALLEIDFNSDTFYNIGDSSPAINDQVFCKGFPRGVWTRHVSKGEVREYTKSKHPDSSSFVLQCNVWMNVIPGMCGGPLLNSDNEVVGVLSTKNVNGTYRGNFISLEEIKTFLNE